MATIHDIWWWTAGLIFFGIFCFVAIIWRNNAAKVDTKLPSKMDNVKNSVSIETKRKEKS